MVTLDGMQIAIWYRGTLAGDEIKFIREVGEGRFHAQVVRLTV